MIDDAPLAHQLAAQQQDRLRVLVVGAGVAGVALAQLLRRQGLHPVLVDRVDVRAHPGYMLALMPGVDAAIRDLGAVDAYRAASTPLGGYRFRSHRGAEVRTDDLGELLNVHGDYRGISRGALLDVLAGDGCPVSSPVTVAALSRRAEMTRVRFDTGAEAEFHLVVGADGMRSRMRELLLPGEVQRVRTGWSGWVAWADDAGDPTLGEELWGDGSFLGVYPVKDRLGVFLGGPDAALEAGPDAFVAQFRRRVPQRGERLDAALEAVLADPAPYLWHLDDARSPRWVLPGGVLLGDAAAGFLPTAGLGAGMAVESAWVLARILDHADRDTLPRLLGAWEDAQRPRIESAQATSRTLARLMFRRGRLLALAREAVLRRMSVRAALGPILRLLEDRPDPDAIARAALAGR
ncbi:FAD-dependent oxidoreductase [Brachybacterium hainanense]|uniref:FAD-dependent oxidoreductase n=1 Tax=Brachybacterium hainanense TaxID=1541174 RepID=A0ABV6R9I1_9MICO